MRLWLDDVRPAPSGWTHVKTVEEAWTLIQSGVIESASLDHDLGACENCIKERLESGGYTKEVTAQGINCNHMKTGYDLVKLMAEHEVWPKEIFVHSANPVGRANMQATIARYKPAPHVYRRCMCVTDEGCICYR